MTYSQIIVNRIATLCKKRSISYNKLANMSGLNAKVKSKSRKN